LESLEAPLAWIDRLASEAIGGELLADLLSHVRDPAASRSEPARQDAKGKSKAGTSKRARTRQVAARSENRPFATKPKKRRRYPQ
jgi:hypothetical protein